MSNCYDHEYKANMLDSYYWDNKVEAKKNLSKNLNKLTDWYKAEQKNMREQCGTLMIGTQNILVEVGKKII